MVGKAMTALFTLTSSIMRCAAKVMKKGSICAILMMDQTEGDPLVFTGEAYKIFSNRMKPLYTISCPQTAEFRVPQYVEKMKEKRLMLGINRTMLVCRK